MVHHKLHDVKWTKVPTAPHEDREPRYLHPPTTTATLNLAAVGAQCARVYEQVDPALAARCLGAAERAWAAAVANPSRLAPSSDSTGGGPYDDGDPTDEFYWAAAELFLTTGRATYHEALLRSPHRFAARTTDEGAGAGFTWQSTRALGTISLSIVPRFATPEEMARARRAIVVAADGFLANVERGGYRTPLAEGKYPWGSNSEVLENAVVMALAHDFTREPKYLGGVVDAMDYVLGRNAVGQSFVTGYGAHPAKHPHHRFWANQADVRYPSPPPGALVGGPNSGIEDPRAKEAFSAGCAPQKCWLDHYESWSTNEVAINWNAALAWVTAFLDEKVAPVTARGL
jgi:endoglucanase